MLQLLLWEDIKAWTRPTLSSLVIKSSKTVKKIIHQTPQVHPRTESLMFAASEKISKTSWNLLYSKWHASGLTELLPGESMWSSQLTKPRRRALASLPCQQQESEIWLALDSFFPSFFSLPAGARPVLQACNSWQVYHDVFLAGRADAIPSACIKDSFLFYFFPSKRGSVQ